MLFPSGQVKELPLTTKEEVSRVILDHVVGLLKTKEGSGKK
jgi:hypothetical protein